MRKFAEIVLEYPCVGEIEVKYSAKKRRKRAKQRSRQAAQVAVVKTPHYRRALSRLADSFPSSHLLRGAFTLTFVPQHPEVDDSVEAQRKDIDQIWRDVSGYMWTAYGEETARIREYEREK